MKIRQVGSELFDTEIWTHRQNIHTEINSLFFSNFVNGLKS